MKNGFPCMVFIAFLSLATGCSNKKSTRIDLTTYAREIESWDQRRLEGLRGRDGWLNLAGLFWLNEGTNTFGADPSNNIVFPGESTPRFIGCFILDSGLVIMKANKGMNTRYQGQPVENILMETGSNPVTIRLNNLEWFVIQRGDRYAIRLRDLSHPNIDKLRAIERYPADPSWRITARFISYDQPVTMKIPTVIGTIEEAVCHGYLEFRYGGRKHRLLPTGDSGKLFLVFADVTSGDETYGGGRFLQPETLADGSVIIDFNKEYNPPCAFTPYATCPMPTRENVLPFPVTAGEKNVHLYHHEPVGKDE